MAKWSIDGMANFTIKMINFTILLAGFKFGDLLKICQIAKLKTSPLYSTYLAIINLLLKTLSKL